MEYTIEQHGKKWYIFSIDKQGVKHDEFKPFKTEADAKRAVTMLIELDKDNQDGI